MKSTAERYLIDVLGVEQIICDEFKPKAQASLELAGFEVKPSEKLNRLLVVCPSLGDREKDLLNRMLASINEKEFQVLELDSEGPEKTNESLMASSVILNFSNLDLVEYSESDASVIFKLPSLDSLTRGQAEQVQEHKKQAWKVLKEVKKKLNEKTLTKNL